MNDITAVAQRYVQGVKNSGIHVIGAYLFGSYAKGNPHKDSDIDICIVSDSFGDDHIKESVNLRKLAFEIDSRIEPIAFSSDDLNDKYSTLASEIKKYGIPVV
jgi:predicted nucleotidyltransferase